MSIPYVVYIENPSLCVCMCVFDLFPVSIHHYSNDLMFFVVVIKMTKFFFGSIIIFLSELFVIIILLVTSFFKTKKKHFVLSPFTTNTRKQIKKRMSLCAQRGIIDL